MENSSLLPIALQFVGIFIAVVHIYIFALESLLWGRPKTNKVFGLSEADSQVTKKLAFNQGFYNLFLAIALIAGVILVDFGHAIEGQTLMDYAVSSVMMAGAVLFVSSPELKRAAAVQIVPAFIYFLIRLV
jgi:putative membrane protein